MKTTKSTRPEVQVTRDLEEIPEANQFFQLHMNRLNALADYLGGLSDLTTIETIGPEINTTPDRLNAFIEPARKMAEDLYCDISEYLSKKGGAA